MRNRTPLGHSNRRRWLAGRWLVTPVLAVVIGLTVTSCAGQLTAEPAGPGSPAPTGTHEKTSKTPSRQTTPSTKPSALTTTGSTSSPSSPRTTAAPAAKEAPPIRPHGNIKQKAKTHSVTRKPRVSMSKSAELPGNIRVSVTRLKSVTAEAVGPGEVGGPAVAVTVRMANKGTQPIDLSTVSVTLDGSDGSPGLLTTGGKFAPLTGTLSAGAKANGTYVFTIAKNLRKPVTVGVQYGDGQIVLQFSGNA